MSQGVVVQAGVDFGDALILGQDVDEASNLERPRGQKPGINLGPVELER